MEEQQNMNMGQPNQSSGGSSGPVIGVIVILIVVILAGLYFWGQRGDNEIEPADDNTVQSVSTQNTSDDTSSIEADLDATDVDSIDAEINAS